MTVIQRRISLVNAADPSAPAVHLRLRGDESTALRKVRAALARHAPKGAPLFLGSAPFPKEGNLGSAPMVDGERIGWGGPLPPATIDRSWTRWELRMVGGPASGQVVPLPPGRHEIGREGASVVIAEDELVSRKHLELEVGEEIHATDLDSSNGTLWEGRKLEERTRIQPGDFLRLGATLLQVVEAARPDLRLVPQPDGRQGLNRRFRSGHEPLPEEVAFPTVPVPGERPGLNLLLTLLPAAGIGAMAVLTSRMEMLLFMAMSPVLGLGSAVARRKQHDRKIKSDHQRYVDEATKAREKLLAARRTEASQARTSQPDPAAVVQCARAAGRLLWARRATDGDLLELRIGSGDRRSSVRAQNADTDDPMLWMAPVTVSLPAVGGVGIMGSGPAARGVARSLVMQAATLHSPAEVRIVVLSDARGEADWEWVRWLPHCRWAADEEFVLVGSDPISTRSRLAELKDLLRRRQDVAATQRGAVLSPTVLVVYDGVAHLMSLGFADILRDGPSVGIYAISVDEAQVPDGCNASVTLGPDGDDAVVEQVGRPAQRAVIADAVPVQVCEAAARCLAPLKLIGEDATAELPGQLRLLDLLGLPEPTSSAVTAGWASTTRDPAAPVGLTTAGPLLVDLTRDGPHGVIAGASRSGKSEFLKTLIASLAARNHPDDLSFLFIDFKGGNDYQVAAMLPHTVDLATQIDQAGFDRSLQLLDAEIIRRQGIAKQLRTSTLEGYWAAQASRPPGSTPTLGRLVVIVDEFAELAQKSPEQLDRLVSVARVGAAYGVHLILATQRPGGVVSGQIDANAPLRVCFRTTAPEHSQDVLGVPLAAEIAERHRGRGYKKAHQELPLEFQCARVGNARPGSSAVSEPFQASVEPWVAVGHLPPEERRVGEVPDPETDFYDLAQAIRAAAVEAGWEHNAVPWPKPLPAVVTLESLPPLRTEDVAACAVPFAVVDDPDRQAHLPAPLVLGAGPVALAGSSGTGRSSALRTVAVSAARQLSARELHLFALDVSGGGLSGLNQLPHCGGVASDDAELTGRILTHLEGAVRSRRSSFERAGAGDLGEYNRSVGEAERLPWLLLLIDGWEILHEESQTSAGSAVHDRILRLLGDGQRFGLQAVVAGDRWTASGKLGRLMKHRFALRFNAQADFDALDIVASQVPEAMPPGRAIGPGKHAYQIGVLGDGSGPAQVAALRSIAESLKERDADVPPDRRPPRIQSLPAKAPLGELLEESPPPQKAKVPVLVGIAASESGPLWVDLAVEAPGFLVVGRRRSGRSNALVAMARSALAAGVQVVAVCGRASSPLAGLAGTPGVVVHHGEAAAGTSLDEVGAGKSVLVLIDDADVLDPMHPGITAMLSSPHPGRAVVASATTEFAKNQVMGYLGTLRRSRSGMILWPESPYDGGALGGQNLPRQLVFDQPEGRAVLCLGGEYGIVQVPLAEVP